MVTEKNVKELENSQASLTLTVDAASIEKAYQARLAKYAKTIEMPGFRKGHVPTSVIERKYGQGIREESTFDCMEENLKETIETLDESQKPLPYSIPELQDEETLLPFKKDSDITFTVKYDIYPKFDLPQYTGLEVEVKKGEVTEDDINSEIKRLQEQNAMVVKKNGPAAEGDIVKVDYVELDAEGNAVADTERKDFTFTIGSGYNFYKLDKDIIGMNAGDEKKVEKTFTAEDDMPGYEGKTVTVSVKLNEVKFRDIPEVDDDFAQDVKDEYKTVDDLKAGIKAQLESSLEGAMKNAKTDAVVDKIVAASSFSVPASMVDAELENSWQSMIRQYGISEEQFTKFIEMQGQTKADMLNAWRDSAVSNIKKQLIVDAIRKKEAFQVNEDEYAAACDKEIKDSYNEEQKAYLKAAIKDDMEYAMVAPFLLENNTFKESEAVSYKEYMTPSEE